MRNFHLLILLGCFTLVAGCGDMLTSDTDQVSNQNQFNNEPPAECNLACSKDEDGNITAEKSCNGLAAVIVVLPNLNGCDSVEEVEEEGLI